MIDTKVRRGLRYLSARVQLNDFKTGEFYLSKASPSTKLFTYFSHFAVFKSVGDSKLLP